MTRPWTSTTCGAAGGDLTSDRPASLWYLGVPLVALLAAVAVVLVLTVVTIFVIELLAIAVIMVIGVVARVILRRPWIVDAITYDAPAAHHSERVVGWRASGDAIQRIARQLLIDGRPTGER